MLKTVSSIVNAIGALNYQGTWNAATNTPTLASGVGTKGDYYYVNCGRKHQPRRHYRLGNL
jgi:hypothetical protein